MAACVKENHYLTTLQASISQLLQEDYKSEEIIRKKLREERERERERERKEKWPQFCT